MLDGVDQRPQDFGIGRLFWMMSDAIVGADLDSGRIVLWNPAAEHLFEYTAAEALGMELSRIVPPDHVEPHKRGIARYAEGGDPVLVGRGPTEVLGLTRSGEIRAIELALTDVSRREDRRDVVAVIRDVTELRRVEARLEEQNAAMRSFVASASHDLNTPLASILGFSEMLRTVDPGVPDDQRQEFAAAIHRSAQRASRLVDSLLTLSQLQAGVLPRNAADVDVASAAREAVRVAAVDAAVSVPAGISVHADADHVHRILVNLLTNAARHGAPPISIGAERVGDVVEIAVVDHGDGIDPAIVARLFEPFTRATTPGGDGAGLGLSIIRGLAEDNGGGVDHRSADGDVGATFVVRLPAANDRA